MHVENECDVLGLDYCNFIIFYVNQLKNAEDVDCAVNHYGR